jgi:alkanesulfonate monooxygenase SsuD/methylene tetrahydromethanopterin reductase-like flavin-dependent oxidoreductase (luciferase family)
MIEGMRAIVEMWTSGEVDWNSDLLRIPRRKIRPQPLQDPHPPMLVACTREDTLQTAGRLGLGVLSNAIAGPGESRRKRAIYDAGRAARQPGDIIGKFANDHFGAAVFTCVRNDAAEARSWGLRGLRYFLENARRYFGGGEAAKIDDGWTDEANLVAIRKILTPTSDSRPPSTTANVEVPTQRPGAGLLSGAFDPDDVLDARSSAMGSAKNTIEFVERMKDAGVDECYFIVQFGGVPHEVTMESIRQIGQNVITHFRKPARTVVL